MHEFIRAFVAKLINEDYFNKPVNPELFIYLK
jgi:hypothetical protein